MIFKLRHLLQENKTTEAIDFVYDTLDELLLNKKFSVVILLFPLFKRADFPLPIYLSVLTITLPYKENLNPERDELFNFTYEKICQEQTELKAQEILKGLK
jgi:hypothetical protein